ncbi:MAG TPA: hypothetical protein VN915_13050 [Elusimicrobiota bacterium]|nr:hypothetical protein [Elusimicrobiota bacterium]
MKAFLAAVLLAAPLSAQTGGESYTATPEQFPGQLARMRLEMLYPKLAAEPPRRPAVEPAARLAGFLAGSAPVLKNVDGLTAYLREGLRDPRAVRGSRQWDEAWTRLDEELGRLRPIVADGEAFLGTEVPPQARYRPSSRGYRAVEARPEFSSPEGLRLHQAVVFAAYAANLREYLIRKSAGTPAERARAIAPSLPR